MTYNTYIAANTFKGFTSYFDELIRDETINHVYLIKGGPGCGKSTLMKKISDFFEKQSFTVEKIYCSSDPDSLDGVKIIEKNIVIIDATSPHSYDMKYPGIKDNIIDISRFWDKNTLIKNKDNIKDLFDVISTKYKSVYSILRSAGIMYTQQIVESENNCDKQKVSEFVKKYIKQNAFIPQCTEAKINNRFLSAISCNGSALQEKTITDICKNGIILEDELNLSSYIISKFIAYFKRSGYEMFLFHNPLCPEYKIDHIIIPKINFGIITSQPIFTTEIHNEKFKIINTKKFISKSYTSENKNKLSLRKKIIPQLISSATEELKEIKSLHDDLEKYYIKSIDYKSLNEYSDVIIQQLCSY